MTRPLLTFLFFGTVSPPDGAANEERLDIAQLDRGQDLVQDVFEEE